MAIDPVEGIAMGAAHALIDARAKSDYDKRLSENMVRHKEFVEIGTNNLLNQAIERAGDEESLGWMYSGSTNSVKMYFTKEEFLQAFIRRNGSIVPDTELYGWNPAWGGPKTEIAIARRAYYAAQHPERAEQILNAPLDNYAIEVRHVETYLEARTRERKEQEIKDKEAHEQTVSIMKWTFIIGAVLFVLYWYFADSYIFFGY